MSILPAYYKKRDSLKDDTTLDWKCRNCGFIRAGDSAPKECPVCSHPQIYFEKTDESG